MQSRFASMIHEQVEKYADRKTHFIIKTVTNGKVSLENSANGLTMPRDSWSWD